MAYKGRKGQNKAMAECRTLNATLPLPKNKGEADKLKKITGFVSFWLGIKDVTRGKVKANWKDVEGNAIGNSYVNLRVTIYTFVFFSLLLTL